MHIIWRHPSQSELTLIILNIELIHLGSEAIYTYTFFYTMNCITSRKIFSFIIAIIFKYIILRQPKIFNHNVYYTEKILSQGTQIIRMWSRLYYTTNGEVKIW